MAVPPSNKKKPRVTERDRGRIEGLLMIGTSQRDVAKMLKKSRNTIAAIAKEMKGQGIGRRTDMDSRKRKKKAKRSSAINALRREVQRIAQIRESQIYHTGKKQKVMERKIVPYGTAPRVRQHLIHLRNKRLDSYKKLKAAERIKKAKAEIHIPSVRAIQRHFVACGFKSRIRPRVPFTPENLDRRLKFASRDEHTDIEFCKRILFSDEHFVTSNDNSNRFQWVKSKKDLVPREMKSKHNVFNSQLWAMIGYNYKSPLLWIDFKNQEAAAAATTVTAKKKKGARKKKASLKQQQTKNVTRLNGDFYIQKILKHKDVYKKLKEKDIVFMQDGATAHNCGKTKEFLRAHKIQFIDDWPSHSPDMNPIEQLWAELNRRISERQRTVPSSVEELRRMAEEEWEAIPMDVVNNFVLSFHAKCERCRKRRGGSAKR